MTLLDVSVEFLAVLGSLDTFSNRLQPFEHTRGFSGSESPRGMHRGVQSSLWRTQTPFNKSSQAGVRCVSDTVIRHVIGWGWGDGIAPRNGQREPVIGWGEHLSRQLL